MTVCSTSGNSTIHDAALEPVRITLKGRSAGTDPLPTREPGTPLSKNDSLESGSGFLASTGYLIRLAHNQKILPQDKGVLLGDRGSLPILPKPVPPKHKPKRKAHSSESSWPSHAPSMCVGADVRIGHHKFGVVDRWLPEKSKWGVTLTSGEKKAFSGDQMQAISSSIARRQKVKVIDHIEIAADADDPYDEDIILARGTRGIVTAVDDEDGGAFMEFECLPGSELPIDRESLKKLKFYQEALDLWTYFYDSIEITPGDSQLCCPKAVDESLEQVKERADAGGETPSCSAVEGSQPCGHEDLTSARDSVSCDGSGVDKENILTANASLPGIHNIQKESSNGDDVSKSLWSIQQTASLCELGEEAAFEGKAKLLSEEFFGSVSNTIAYLNSSEGFAAVPDGHCVVFSAQKQTYFLLYRRDQQAAVFDLFNLRL